MPFASRLFSGDAKLEAALTSDPAHITPGSKGEHVTKIQTALFVTDGASVSSSELTSQTYGPSTANAVLAYKTKRQIINRAYQKTADNIVGKMTVARLDEDVAKAEATVVMRREHGGPPVRLT